MLYVDNNKVCPKCGTYSAFRRAEDKSICVMGHIVELNKYITLEEWEKERKNDDTHKRTIY